MIHKALNKSEIARRYYEKLGEKVTNQEAVNRFRFVRSPDKKVIDEIRKEINREWSEMIKP